MFDDRDIGAGEKFADSDLIGIPIRLVVSDKTDKKIEFKMRNSKVSTLFDFDEVVKKLI